MPPRPPIPEAVFTRARVAMSGPGRAYHDPRHLDEVLARYDEVAEAEGWRQPAEVVVALLLHDAVYEVGRSDNEAASAELARRVIAEELTASAPVVSADRVAELILLTARHASLAPGDVDRDAALFLDCDMAILGAPPARYDEYERAVAEEYAAIPEALYRAGRRAFLERVAAAPRIFLSDYFHARLDAQARDNVRRALG